MILATTNSLLLGKLIKIRGIRPSGSFWHAK